MFIWNARYLCPKCGHAMTERDSDDNLKCSRCGLILTPAVARRQIVLVIATVVGMAIIFGLLFALQVALESR